jgi:DNA mismatch repair protein MutS2
LRREITECKEQVRRALERFARRPEIRSLVRSFHPAIRDGRYVLAVRSGARGQVRGLYHDRSATGQTAYVEPEIVVADQNRLRDLEIDEQREVNRILFRLTRLALDRETDIEATALAIARIDHAFARAAVADELGLVEPELTAGRAMTLAGARHPLLLCQRFDESLAAVGEGETPSLAAARRRAHEAIVPFTLSLGDTFDLLVLTGPNTGGKTATLKALGAIALLARAGHFVPAEGCPRIPFHPAIFADIGDEQDLAQSLSTFSAHVKRIARILESAPRGSLVLLDELGTGTDPLEGEALATALLEELLRRGLAAVVTTHLGRLKEFAGREPRAANASMQFDPESLRPTYRLLLGVPGASNALKIARNLGLAVKLVDRAEQLLAGSGDGTASLFAELDRARAELERLREDAERDRRDAAKQLGKVERQRAENELAEAALLVNAEEAAEARLRAFATEIEEPRRQLLAAGGKAALVAGKILDALRRMLAASPLAEHRKRFLKSLRPGDSVKLIKLNEVGRVKRVLTKSDRVEVEVRHLLLTVGVDDVSPAPRG